jgi:hypothetical protein
MSIPKKDPIQILGFVILAIQKASELIGSINWKGRFRTFILEAVDNLHKTNSYQNEALSEMAEAMKLMQVEIDALKEKMEVLYKS